MVLVKNRLNQMLVINVPEEDAIIFLAKQQKELTHSQYQAPEMQNHINAGNIVVLRISE